MKLEDDVMFLTNSHLQNNLLDPNQSGFKSGHSTETALLSLTEAFKTATAAAQSSAVILLDLPAAFEIVNHRILLSLYCQVWAFLAGHTPGLNLPWALVQRVMARSAVCTSPPHHKGAPRLVMGPLLFAIYT